MIERDNNFIKRYRQFTALSLSEIQVLFIALILLPLTAFLLKIKGFRRTQIFLNRFISEKTHTSDLNHILLEKAQGIAKLVSIAANHGPYRANCLKKSLVIWWLLGRRGIQTNLKIGVKKDEESFNAHAWVEFEGVVLNERGDVGSRFSAFDKNINSESCNGINLPKQQHVRRVVQ